jgi:hypothetical protein
LPAHVPEMHSGFPTSPDKDMRHARISGQWRPQTRRNCGKLT